MDGPQRSMSNTPTSIHSSWARASAKFVVKVLFPTPPFPLILLKFIKIYSELRP